MPRPTARLTARRTVRRTALAAVLLPALLAAACAPHAPKAAATGAVAVQPPALLSSGRPEWKLPTRGRDGVVLDLRVEVQVDAAGRADPATLRVTGVGVTENRDALVTWLQTARFRPAQREGQPVAGTFSTRFSVRVESRQRRG